MYAQTRIIEVESFGEEPQRLLSIACTPLLASLLEFHSGCQCCQRMYKRRGDAGIGRAAYLQDTLLPFLAHLLAGPSGVVSLLAHLSSDGRS